MPEATAKVISSQHCGGGVLVLLFGEEEMYGRHGENSTNWSEQLIGGGGDDCFAVEIRRAEKPRNMRMSMPELSRVPLSVRRRGERERRLFCSVE